ncbi:hypothetical protein [Rhodococcus sp. GXMU-t2271]|uniref:hypothetical protein n=1 Tax=Rhodococcus sp. GXMU-t2271 TaxID=3059079 RepID=UPI00352A7B29
MGSLVSDRERDLVTNSPVSVLAVLARTDLPPMITDPDDPNSLVYVMQDAAMQGWKYSALLMVASVVATAIVFAVFMPWRRGRSLIDSATGPDQDSPHPSLSDVLAERRVQSGNQDPLPAAERSQRRFAPRCAR